MSEQDALRTGLKENRKGSSLRRAPPRQARTTVYPIPYLPHSLRKPRNATYSHYRIVEKLGETMHPDPATVPIPTQQATEFRFQVKSLKQSQIESPHQ